MLKSMNIEAAIADLRRRTLPYVPGEIGRLIYLAATRDYNTGKYYHDGLASAFSNEVANQALEECHNEIFRSLVESSLEDIVGQLERYLSSICEEASEIIGFWERIEPYRIAVPVSSDPLSARLFCSNIKIALAILKSRAKNRLNS